MKYSERDELVAGLRELADFLDQHGHKLPGSLNIYVSEFVYDDYTWDSEAGKYVDVPNSARHKMKKIVRTLAKGGRADKDWIGNYLDVKRKFGPITVKYSINRERICERVVVGTKEVPEQIIPARTEEVYEYICDEPVLLS